MCSKLKGVSNQIDNINTCEVFFLLFQNQQKGKKKRDTINVIQTYFLRGISKV